ncbi:alpha/beta hydrolase [Neobacillus sp. MER 74]|uniref:alpha/beta fold hydrolase n=1 Tax=Neobacillus sp. MER 74 TaxID=2939566 RepID=UPI00203E7ADA|nr:alpha/beta hydrolase [Neobacillus sp. MER 74]MCM3114220.1 alpha/beta hydrolase [Neobacillus sp. MER 74]
MSRVSFCCSEIPYLRFGAGEPLVFIHGLGEVKEGWNNQFEFADQFDLIIPDLRGHGEHTTDEKISIPQLAHDIITLLNDLQVESAHVCGLSMGGLVAQEIYRQAPQMCRSLMLVSTFHFIPRPLAKLLINYRRVRSLSTTPSLPTKTAARISLNSWKGTVYQNFHKFYKPNHEVFLKSVKACLEVNNLKLLPQIKVPTLIMGSQYDSVIPVWIQLLMHKQIRHSEFVILRNTGHIAKLEQKDAFNRVIRNFLKKHSKVS